MKKLRSKIKNIKDYDLFLDMLSTSLKTNDPFSDNPMLDGAIIGFILTTSFSKDLFCNKDMGRVLDGTIQKLEQITLWVIENEDVLCKRLDQKKKEKRSISLSVWSNLEFLEKLKITNNNSEILHDRGPLDLTGREIQMLWEKD